jgi:hypothetical protein
VREFAQEIGVPARAVWAQARRRLPDLPTVKPSHLRLVQRAASPARTAMTCVAPGTGGKLCGKAASGEELVDGVLCPLCRDHVAELRAEGHEELGESLQAAASPRRRPGLPSVTAGEWDVLRDIERAEDAGYLGIQVNGIPARILIGLQRKGFTEPTVDGGRKLARLGWARLGRWKL